MAKPLLRAAVTKSFIVRVIVEMEPVMILCDEEVGDLLYACQH